MRSLALLGAACYHIELEGDAQLHVKCKGYGLIMVSSCSSMAERFSIQRVPLSAKDQEKATNELRETPEVVKEALDKLRKLIQGTKKTRFSWVFQFFNFRLNRRRKWLEMGRFRRIPDRVPSPFSLVR